MSLRQAIRNQNAKWIKAYNRGDAAAVAALYADDAVLLPPGAKRFVRGRARIRSSWAGAIEEFADPKFTTLALEPLDEGTIGEFGKFTVKLRKGAQRNRRQSGKYVVIWQKVGASWLMRSDMAYWD